jgi:hypothetical protein
VLLEGVVPSAFWPLPPVEQMDGSSSNFQQLPATGWVTINGLILLGKSLSEFSPGNQTQFVTENSPIIQGFDETIW